MLAKILKYKHCYIFIAPFYILFIIFFIYQVFYSLRASFYSFKGVRPFEFIGFNNYINLFKDRLLYISLGNTFYIWIIFIPLVIILALVISSLLDAPNLKLGPFYRTAIFMPLIVSTVVITLVFYIFFQNNGLLNYFLIIFKIQPVNWLNSYFWSKPIVILILLWRWTGYYTILMFAGLQNIDKNLYEAASIDGAGTLGIFFRIKIPLLINIIFFCIVIGTIDVLQLFTEPFLLTRGGPGNATTTLGLYLYNTAFKFGKIGYASSMGYVIVLFFVIIAIFNVKRVRMK